MTFKAPATAANLTPQRQLVDLTRDPANAALVADLMAILSFSRPAGSKTDDLFCAKFLDVIPDMHTDEYGNRWLQVGKDPEIMWSCHTDTVDRREGTKTLRLENGWIKLAKSSAKVGTCLGADDGAGIWLMLEMIKAGIGGLYAFHRDEEIGGLGSSWAAKNVPHYMQGIKCAIAFDRKGYTSVITHQGSRTCSDAFADSLAATLGMGFKKDDGGLFTDTANYTDLIGECTNLSVGYFDAHGPRETLDADFLLHLRKALIEADFSQLVFKREPGEADPEGYGRWGSSWKDDYRSQYGWDDLFDNDIRQDAKGNTLGRKKKRSRMAGNSYMDRGGRLENFDPMYGINDLDDDARGRDPWGDDGYDLDNPTLSQNTAGYRHFGDPSVLQFVKNNPGLVADFLEYNGFSTEDVSDFAQDVHDPMSKHTLRY